MDQRELFSDLFIGDFRAALGCAGKRGGLFVDDVAVVGAEAEFDERARIRDDFSLPSILRLQSHKRLLGVVIELAAGVFGLEIAGLDQRVLDLNGALVINALLSALAPVL